MEHEFLGVECKRVDEVRRALRRKEMDCIAALAMTDLGPLQQGAKVFWFFFSKKNRLLS